MSHDSGKDPRFFEGFGIAAVLIFGGASLSPAAVTRAQADSAYNAWWSKYYNSSNNTFFKTDARTGRIDFWRYAHDWENMQDRYKLTRDPTLIPLMKNLWNGFNNTNGMGTDWKQNDYNDDIEWWVISATRAYMLTGDTAYRNTAKRNFDWVWSTQWDNTLGGGIWWKNTDRLTKNACSNGPGTAAAMNLYLIYNDTSYLNKARLIYTWERGALFNATSGSVADHMNANGSLSGGALYYNQGTFFGPAIQLWRATGNSSYYNDAIRAIDYVRNNMSNRTTGILNNGGLTGDGSTFMLIFIRYMMDAIIDGGLTQYRDWMTLNAETAWRNRRQSDNIMSSNFNNLAPGSGIESSSASGGLAIVTLSVLSTTPIFPNKPKNPSIKNFEGNNGEIFSLDGRRVINIGNRKSNLVFKPALNP